MKTLADYRRELDGIDDELLAVLSRRFAVTKEIRALKAKQGLPRVDPAREREILAKAAAAVDPAERDTACGVYERILSGSRGMIETIARGICVREGKILLCRAKGSASTYLPGGHIEFGETGREALVREIREELGVESEAADFLGVVENSFLQQGKPHAEINLLYRLRFLGSVPTESKEDWIEFEWVDVDRIETANLLPAEMIKYAKLYTLSEKV